MSILNKSCRFLTIILNNNVRYKTTNYHVIPKISVARASKRNFHLTYGLQKLISWNMADIGEGIQEVIVKQWFVKVGDRVKEFDNICEVQSDKALATITSRYTGVIKKLHYKVEETAHIGKPFIDIEAEGDVAEQPTTSTPPPPSQPSPASPVKEAPPTRRAARMRAGLGRAHTSEPKRPELKQDAVSHEKRTILCVPAVRKLAKEKNVNLHEVSGTGNDGRILKEDVLNYLAHGPGVRDRRAHPASKTREDKTLPLTQFQKVMAKHLAPSLDIPAFLICDQVDVTALIRIKNSVKKASIKAGSKLTLTPFLLKAASSALTRYPMMNATVDEPCEHITIYGAHNIGLAMDTKVGLAVPVIKNVDQLSIFEISRELNRLSKQGKAGAFSPSDLKGASFILSNIGSIGGTYGKPSLSPPAVAILGVGSMKTLPRIDRKRKMIARDFIYINGVADHRVIDGATLANFLNHFKRQIENPYLLLLDL